MSRLVSIGGCMTALALVCSLPAYGQSVSIWDEDEGETVLQTLVVRAASEELRQALGVSTITAEDLENRPTGRDLSEIIRTMPGVNLSGNTASGQRGNQRQIDIRGMGPENVLILIDGKPVLSRNSVRMGRQGERDTRGDTSWVPPELIERIEVIRGPAAARYGSGAAGGVVNIVTRQPQTTTFNVSLFAQIPEHSDEGGTRRTNVVIGGPINDVLSYRLMGNVSWTDPDDPEINDQATGSETSPAGREGVASYDVRGLWSAQVNPDHRLDLELAYSLQANRFAGDRQTGTGSIGDLVDQLAAIGAETNRTERTTLALTHFGTYSFGESESYIQWEHTYNRRLSEGTSGGGEGNINNDSSYRINTLDNITAKTEWDIPLFLLADQTVTLGAEYRGEFMESVNFDGTTYTPFEGGETESHLVGLFIEDNILVTDRLTVTPGLRMDVHSNFGLNFSPSLNASYALTDEITIKGGIARAFKAPNLFQLNPDYLWNTMGMGCPSGVPTPCQVRGNPDLDPEISVNAEIGIAYANVDGWAASLTYFHNEYENRIEASGDPVPNPTGGSIMYWDNVGPATIRGLEGSVAVPLHETVSWTTNFTYMLESRDHRTGQPLSLIPEYTINTGVRWEAMENLGLTLSATHYGKIEPRTLDHRGNPITDPASLETRDPYTIFNFGLDYEFNENLKLTAGVNNLFDERLFRTNNGTGANTFNEPGRSYTLSLTGRF